ncbi:MAG: hypothetical protein E4H01_12230 [Lysobacterales bacterium]|nr:MAG: hypothetical protein E4H01_12230 [Xanthomonadales bacterium]
MFDASGIRVRGATRHYGRGSRPQRTRGDCLARWTERQVNQGINILPGSFMTGQIRWAYAGIVTALIGGGLLWIALRVGKG